MMFIGKRIRQLREQRGLSQGDIEAVSGMLRAYVSRVEHGHTVPSLETTERFAAALDVPLYFLFYEEDAVPTVNPTSDQAKDTMAKEPGPKEAEARMLTMLKGLTQRMVDSDKQLLLDFANQLASRSARAVEGLGGERRLRASKRRGHRKFGRLAAGPTTLPCGTGSRAASVNEIVR